MPATLVPRFGIDFIHGSTAPHSTVPDGPFWCVYATAFVVEQTLSPALLRLAHPVFDHQQALLTTGRDANNDKRAELVILAPKAAVNTVSPDLDYWFIVQICVSPAVVFVGPTALTA